MRKLAGFLSAASLFFGVLWTAHAQESEARSTVLKALKAHGGAEKLAKLKAVQAKGAGTLEINNMVAKVSTETFVQFPDKVKNVVELEINNMNIAVTSVFNGTTAWVHVMGRTMELKDKKLIEMFHENMYAERVTALVELTDPKYQLDLMGEVKIMNQDAIGVRVSSKGRRDVSLFFDKKTHLLIKSESRGVDPISNQEVNMEKYFSDFREVDGIQSPRKVTIHTDGKKLGDMEISEVRYLERHDDGVFAMP
jgi:hypothetical protein